MKRVFLVLCVIAGLVGCVTQVRADDLYNSDPPEDFTRLFKGRVWSRYIASNGQLLHQDPVLQIDLTITHRSGLYFNTWTSIGLESLEINDDYGDEVDLSLGLANVMKIADAKVNYDIGASYYTLYDLGHSDDDLWQLYAEVL